VLLAGMKIATYANARTALEARKGVAPAFMTGERPERCSMLASYHRCYLLQITRVLCISA